MEMAEQIVTLRALCAERDEIERRIEDAADQIQRRAHEINEAGHWYSRSGYYPWFQRFDNDGKLIFEGDNSWDGAETYRFTQEQLLAGPEPVAEEYAAAQRKAAKRDLAAAESRAARLREQLKDEV